MNRAQRRKVNKMLKKISGIPKVSQQYEKLPEEKKKELLLKILSRVVNENKKFEGVKENAEDSGK